MALILGSRSETLAQNRIDIEKCGYRVEVIKPNIAALSRPEDKELNRLIKKEVRQMSKKGWKLYNSDKSIKEVLEWLFYAHGDDNVVVLEEHSTASNFEDGWHWTFSKAVLNCLGQFVDPVIERENEENDSIINALSDDYMVIDSAEWGILAYKYNLEGFSYKSIGLEPVDSTKGITLANLSYSLSWDFETVEIAKKKVASGYVVSMYRRLKDVETTQPMYEIMSFFVVKASDNSD